MKKFIFLFVCLVLMVSCAIDPRYSSTVTGAVVGGGMGAVIGGAAGGGEGALVGAAIGAAAGSILGNVDDSNRAAYAQSQPQVVTNKRESTTYESDGTMIRSFTMASDYPNCTKEYRQFWKDGRMIREETEEYCTEPPPPSVYYYSPAPRVYIIPRYHPRYGYPYRHDYYYRHHRPYHRY
jgi:hypothetical protein